MKLKPGRNRFVDSLPLGCEEEKGRGDSPWGENQRTEVAPAEAVCDKIRAGKDSITDDRYFTADRCIRHPRDPWLKIPVTIHVENRQWTRIDANQQKNLGLQSVSTVSFACIGVHSRLT